MRRENRSLREQLRKVGEAKRAGPEDASFWLALPPEERLARAIAHCDAMLRSFPPSACGADDEVETWARVDRRLRAGR